MKKFIAEAIAKLIHHGLVDLGLKSCILVVTLLLIVIVSWTGENMSLSHKAGNGLMSLDRKSRETLSFCSERMKNGEPKVALRMIEARVSELGLYQPSERFLAVAISMPEFESISEEIAKVRSNLTELIKESN